MKSSDHLPDILQAMAARPLIFDGAMGTMIYTRGVFLNACYDELCLTKPQLIADIHKEYVNAGVDVIETNTFGANRFKLAFYGLADKVEMINRAAVQLARASAGADVYVAASVGPCLKGNEHFQSGQGSEIATAFNEQIRILIDAGIDLLILETFHSMEEMLLALSVAGGYDVPLLASFSLDHDRSDAEVAWASTLNGHPHVDMIGLNCGVGPAQMLQPLQRVIKHAQKPVVAMPNAGGPSDVGGRQLYLNSPEFFSEFCKRYIEVGARGVGGCCGTTPLHLAMATRAVRCISGVKTHLDIVAAPTPAVGQERDAAPATPMAEKSAFARKLAAGQKVNSVEMLPPRDASTLAKFTDQCRACKAAGVDAINLPDGPRASARISVTAAAYVVQRDAGIEPIPHYCCRDRNLIGMQSDLLGGAALGLRNWLFITGDPPKLGQYPNATGVFDVDAIGLCRLASNLNRGVDAVGESIGRPTDLLIGVGANPVAVDLEREIERFFRKIDAGAEYAMTQPVFDVDTLLRFMDRVQRHSPTIPIVAGIFPLVSFKNAEFMNTHVPGVVVPPLILTRMRKCQTKEDGLKTGLEIAREICERIANRVAGFQISAPLGRIEPVLNLLKSIES